MYKVMMTLFMRTRSECSFAKKRPVIQTRTHELTVVRGGAGFLIEAGFAVIWGNVHVVDWK